MAVGGTTIASLKATVGLDDSDLQRGLQRSSANLEKFARDAESTGKRVGQALSGWGSKLTVGLTLPIVGAGAAMVKFASDANESLNKVQVVFGQSAAGIEAWSKSAATAMGMSSQKAQEAASTLGNLFKTTGLGQEQAAQMSRSMVQLAADLGSFNNIGTDEALQKIRSGLVGEAEPLRTVGVLLTEDAVKAQAMKMGLGDAHGELTEGQKVLARYALILKQSGAAQGDFSRTADGFANSTKTMQGEVEDLAASLGKELLPIAKDLLHVVLDLVRGFNAMDPATKKTALGFAAAAAAAGPLLKIAGGLSALFGGLGGAGKALATGGKVVAAGVPAAAGTPVGMIAALTAASDAASGFVSGLGQKAGIPKPIADALSYGANLPAWVLKNLREAGGSAMGLLAPKGKAGAGAAAAGRPAAPNYTIPPEMAGPTGKTSMPEIQDLQYEAQLQMARTGAAGAPEEQNAQAEAAAVVPLLSGRITQLTARQKALEPKIKTNTDAAKEYYKLTIEGWKLQEQITQLQSGAASEIKSNQDKARQKQLEAFQKYQEQLKAQAQYRKETQDSFKSAEEEYFRTQAEGGPEGQEAAHAQEVLVPHLRQVQAQLVETAKRLNPQMKEYWDQVKEYWGAEKQIRDLGERAGKEQENAVKQAAEAAKRQAQEQKQLVSAREKLAEEQIKNTIGTSDEQKKKMLQPFLKAEYRGLLKPVAGESEAERLERLTEAERVKGRILEGAGLTGKGANRRVLGGGSVFTGDRRAAQQTLGELAGMERDAQRQVTVQLAPPPQGYPIFGQLFQDPQFKIALDTFINQYLSGGLRQMMPQRG